LSNGAQGRPGVSWGKRDESRIARKVPTILKLGMCRKKGWGGRDSYETRESVKEKRLITSSSWAVLGKGTIRRRTIIGKKKKGLVGIVKRSLGAGGGRKRHPYPTRYWSTQERKEVGHEKLWRKRNKAEAEKKELREEKACQVSVKKKQPKGEKGRRAREGLARELENQTKGIRVVNMNKKIAQGK